MVVGECCSKYFATSEPNQPSSFMNSILRVEGSISQFTSGDTVYFENKSEVEMDNGATMVSSTDGEPPDFMKELDFGMQRREHKQHEGQLALHRICYEDVSFGLHLSDGKPSWL